MYNHELECQIFVDQIHVAEKEGNKGITEDICIIALLIYGLRKMLINAKTSQLHTFS